MSDTETRETDEREADAEFALSEIARLRRTARRHRVERDEAEAEVERLRGVVEAVRALAEEWGIFSGDDDDFFEAITDSGSWRFARDLRAVLVPVLSSGETGERAAIDLVPCCDHCGCAPGNRDGHDDTCKHGCNDAPASPEPTGADEGYDWEWIERACEIMHDAYEAAAVGAGWQTQQASRKPWADVPEPNKATMRAAVTALLDHLAARPVLSREALRGRLNGHWPASDGTSCACGWRGDRFLYGADRWRDHLAAVLDTQEAVSGR